MVDAREKRVNKLTFNGSEKNAPWFLSWSKDAPMRLAACTELVEVVREAMK